MRQRFLFTAGSWPVMCSIEEETWGGEVVVGGPGPRGRGSTCIVCQVWIGSLTCLHRSMCSVHGNDALPE